MSAVSFRLVVCRCKVHPDFPARRSKSFFLSFFLGWAPLKDTNGPKPGRGSRFALRIKTAIGAELDAKKILSNPAIPGIL